MLGRQKRRGLVRCSEFRDLGLRIEGVLRLGVWESTI